MAQVQLLTGILPTRDQQHELPWGLSTNAAVEYH